MTIPVTLNNIANLQDTTTAQTNLNANNATVVGGFSTALNVTGDQMKGNLDMNSNQILNLPAPATANSPVRLQDVVTPVSTSTSILSGNNVFTGSNSFNAAVTFSGPLTGVRQSFTQNMTFYVDVTNGNDSNSGLTTGVGNAWKTINHAINTICNKYDLAGHTCVIQLADGTYPETITCFSYVGRAQQGHGSGTAMLVQGNTSNAANVVIAPVSGRAINNVGTYFEWDFQYISVTSATENAIYTDLGAWTVLGNVVFGPAPSGSHVISSGITEFIGPYTISPGTSQNHIVANNAGTITYSGGATVTLTGTTNFLGVFALASDLSFINCPASMVFSGAATGSRYNVFNNSVIDTGGSGSSFFPGSATGTTSAGGVYA